jgi:hypothetical protein
LIHRALVDREPGPVKQPVAKKRGRA